MTSLNQVEAPRVGVNLDYNSKIGDYFELMKPGVMSLVVFTALVGMIVAPGSIHPFFYALVLLCVAIGSGASGAINMWYDSDIDSIMIRTAKRPIPSGRIAPDNVLALGVILSIFSVLLLGLVSNWLAAGLLAAAICFYVFIYTMGLKRRTPQNIVIGGAAGAFPPMIGWAAVTGNIDPMSIVMFLIIFFWTPPHFWALAICKAAEYAKVGVPMLPVTNGIDNTKKQMFVYSLILFSVTLLPWFMHRSGIFYTVVAVILGVAFSMLCYINIHKPDKGISGKIFLFSILYMFILFAAIAVDSFILGFGHL